MASPEFNKLYAPPENVLGQNNDEVYRWVEDNKERGLRFLRSNSAWRIADICFDILIARDKIRRPIGLSILTIKKLRRMMREIVAVQSNLRPRWMYKTFKRGNATIQQLGVSFGKLFEFWWFVTFADRVFKNALQFAAGGGTGYVCLEIDDSFDGINGNRQISAHALNHRQVIPFHPPPDNNIQKAYAVALYYEMDLPEAHRKYHWATDIIQADRNAPSKITRAINSLPRPFRGVVDWVRNRKAKSDLDAGFPTVDILKIYVNDDSINTSEEPVEVGYGNHKFIVPSLYTREPNDFPVSGEEELFFTTIPTGRIIDGIPQVRAITAEECLFYPNRRLIIWCSGGIIYDGPANNYHGRVPVAQFRFDDVASEFLGFPVIMDSKPLVDSANNAARSWEDSTTRKAYPDLAVDESVPSNIIDELRNKSRFGRVIKYPVRLLAKAVIPLVPHEYFQFDRESYAFIEKLLEWADDMAGTKQSANWAKLKQLPAGDNVEAMLQATGDLPVDQARNIERGLLELGPIWLGLALECYDTQRVIQILGGEEIIEVVQDFDPTSLVPLEDKNDPRPRWLRIREFMANFPFYAAPNSLQERQSVTRQLQLLQGKKIGLPIPDKMIFERMYPEENYEESKKLYYQEMEEKSVAAAKVQIALKNALEEATQPNFTLQGLLRGIMDGTINPADLERSLSGGNPQNAGRPSTDAKAPQLEQKVDEAGIPRETMTTS